MSEGTEKQVWHIPVVDTAELATRLASRKQWTQLHLVGHLYPQIYVDSLRTSHGNSLDLSTVFILRKHVDLTILAGVRQLQRLSIIVCDLSNVDWQSLTHHRHSLTVLIAKSAAIGPEGAAKLAEQLKYIPQLTTLDLWDNKFGPEGAAKLAELLEHVPDLTSLRLGCNRIGADAAARLVGQLKHVPNLTTLDLCRNRIGPEGAAKLAEHLGDIPNLTTLDLSWNGIGPEGAAKLAEHIGDIPNLTTLDMGWNEISSEGAAALAEHFEDVPNLTTLDLGYSALGPEGIAAVAEYFEDIPNLTTLDLNYNALGPEGVAMLAERFVKAPNLAKLNLNDNEIGPKGAMNLAQHFDDIPNLTHLELCNNEIGDEGIRYIAKCFEHNVLRKLVYLRIGGNNICCLDEAVIETSDGPRILNGVLYGESLPQVRIMLVGMGGVGKSLLARRTFLNQVQKEGEHDETHDIVLLSPEDCKWMPPFRPAQVYPEPAIQTWVWDFAGQLVTHGVHESFLADDGRTVYILVLAADREPDRESDEREENRLRYWLQMLRYTVGSRAPVIIVITRNDKWNASKGKRPVDSLLRWPEWSSLRPLANIPKGDIRSLTQVHVVEVVSDFSACDASYPIERGLHQSIANAVSRLNVVHGRRVPRELPALKEVVDQRLARRTVITRKDYGSWCDEKNVRESGLQDELLRILHHFGSVTYWGQTPTERTQGFRQFDDNSFSLRPNALCRAAPAILQTHVLNPKWFKCCVYAITRASEELVEGRPRVRLTNADIDRIVAQASAGLESISDDYEVEGGVIREALTFIGVCWEDARGNFVFPRGLPELVDITPYTSGESTQLIWDFLPEHCVAKLIVRLHEDGLVVSRKKGSHVHGPNAALIEYPRGSGVETFVLAVPAVGRVEIYYGVRSTGEQRQTVLSYLLTLLQSPELQGRKPDEINGAPSGESLGVERRRVIEHEPIKRVPKDDSETAAIGAWLDTRLDGLTVTPAKYADFMSFYEVGRYIKDHQPGTQEEIAEKLNRKSATLSRQISRVEEYLETELDVKEQPELLVSDAKGNRMLSEWGHAVMRWLRTRYPADCS